VILTRLNHGVAFLLYLSLVCHTSSLTLGNEPSPEATVETAKPTKPVKFIQYDEQGEWTTWSDTRLSIRIPANWNVAEDETEAKANEWNYELQNEQGEHIFAILVKEGGPEWISCFCVPYREYEYTEKKPYKIWAITHKRPKTETRTVKVANEKLRLDIHVMLPTADAQKVRYIAESARVTI